MSKIDNVTKDLGQTDRPLRDDELESVIGGCCNGGHDVGRPVFGVTALGNLGLLQNYRPTESI
jgi:hypothetical protein